VLKVPLLVDQQSRRISSFHNLLYFNYYFRKYFKLVYNKNVFVVTIATSVRFLLFICMHFGWGGILRRWSACVPIAYELSAIAEILRKTVLQIMKTWNLPYKTTLETCQELTTLCNSYRTLTSLITRTSLPADTEAVFRNLFLPTTHPMLTMAREGTPQNFALRKGHKNNV
jgi:hypothetical protein